MKALTALLAAIAVVLTGCEVQGESPEHPIYYECANR